MFVHNKNVPTGPGMTSSYTMQDPIKEKPGPDRGAHTGELGVIADILSEYAEKPDFIRYGEDIQKSKLNLQQILPLQALWTKLYGLHPSLSFKQSDMETVFLKVADIKGPTWVRKLNKEEVRDFKKRMSKRFRAMARHVAQGILKKTAWALELVGEEVGKTDPQQDEEKQDEEEGAEEETKEQDNETEEEKYDEEDEEEEAKKRETKSDEIAKEIATAKGGMKRPAAATSVDTQVAKRPASAPSFFYGFDQQLQKAWREPSTGGKRCFACVSIPEKADPKSFPVACFDGDEEIEIKQITVGELQDRNNVQLAARGCLWEGTSQDGTALKVIRFVWQTSFSRCRYDLLRRL